MSRCFPFPPPNYHKERDLNADLRFTESIKKEQESLSKEKRKDRKRERKEKKDKSKDLSSEKSKHGHRSHKKQKLNDNEAVHSTVWFDSKSQPKKNLPLMKDDLNNGATDLMKGKLQIKDERSGITEERTLRVLEPCESSESTENSSKAGRKLETNNANCGNNNLRFKLPPQKPKDQKPALAADLLSTSNKTGPRIVKATQANEEPCFPGRKTAEVQKVYLGGEGKCFVGRSTPQPKVLKASQALPSKGASSFSAQHASKSKGASAFPTSEPARCSGRAIPRPKVDVPCFSGRAPPKPVALKSSPATDAAKLPGRSLPEPKALKPTPVPILSGRSLPEPKALKPSPVPRLSGRSLPEPKVPKLTPVPKLSGRVSPRADVPKSSPATEAAKLSGRSLPEPKALKPTPVPRLSGRVAPRPDVLKGPPASKADLKTEVEKSLPATKANCSSVHNVPKPEVIVTQINGVPCFPAWPAPSVVDGAPGVSVKTLRTSVATAPNEAPCSSGHATKALTVTTTELDSGKRKHKRSRKHHDDTGRRYEELFANWKPEPLIVHEEEDLSWLFSKSEKQSKTKSDAPVSVGKSCAAADSQFEKLRHTNPAYAFQPRAQYIPEIDVYALPYTVPF